MAENEQGTVTIDGKTYRLDQLSDTAKAQLANIRYVDREIEQARNHLAVLQAARQYYAQVLTRELPQPQEGEA